MEVFTKSIISWSEPKSFYEHYEKKLNEINPRSKIIYARYIFPTIISVISVVAIFAVISFLFETEFLSFTFYFCLVASVLATPVIQLASKNDRKRIYFYKRKILIYDGSEGRQDLKLKNIEHISIEEFSDDNYTCDYLKIFDKKAKEYSIIINHEVNVNELITYFKKQKIKIT